MCTGTHFRVPRYTLITQNILQIYSILNAKLLKSYELAKLKLSRNRRYPIYSEFTTVFLTIKADLLQHTRFPTHSKSTSHLMLVSALNLC